MLDPDEIDRQIRNLMMTGLEDPRLIEVAERFICSYQERDRRLSDTLDQLLMEVDEMLLMLDLLEEEGPEEG
jgi:hypothetical protein